MGSRIAVKERSVVLSLYQSKQLQCVGLTMRNPRELPKGRLREAFWAILQNTPFNSFAAERYRDLCRLVERAGLVLRTQEFDIQMRSMCRER